MTSNIARLTGHRDVMGATAPHLMGHAWVMDSALLRVAAACWARGQEKS
jgi:hypothetical protein